MTLKTYTRFELAENQLNAAIGLFVSGGDRFSVITLAGAADVILSRLVIKLGKKNFTELTLQSELENLAKTVTRESFGKAMNDTLYINQLKHMDDDDDGFIEMEPEECALASILKALVNYIILVGDQSNMVMAFRAWMRINLDPKKYNIYGDSDWKSQIEESNPSVEQ
jgi:hypothetical protein